MKLGFRREKKSGSAELKKLLGDVELPTIPAVVIEAIDRIADPETGIKEVAAVIARDPGLSARLLTIANSAAYAPRQPIASVEQAVMMLGSNHVESVLVSLAASRAMRRLALPGFDLAKFWSVAAWRAATAAELAMRLDRERRAENFTGALLLDVAVPVILRCRPQYQAVLREWRDGVGELEDLEREALGFTHGEVASWMFEEWKFPASLRRAVAETGDPETDDVEFPIVRVVASLGHHEDPRLATQHVAGRIERVFGIDGAQAEALVTKARESSASLARSLH